MKKALYYWTSLFFYVLVVIGVVGLVNFAAAKYYKRLDLTHTAKFTLSPQTMKILKNLRHKIKTIAFVKDDPLGRVDQKRLMEQYEWAGKNFTWEFVDPDKKKLVAEKYKVTRYNTYVVERDDGKKKTFIGRFNEETLTNAIIKVVSEKAKKAYFTTGHGEKDINGTGGKGYSRLVEGMKKENFEVADIQLFAVEGVPKDAAVLIVAGPSKDLPKSELDKIESYLRSGGKLILMADPYTMETGTMETGETVKFLEKFGIRLNDDIIIDKVSKTIGGDYLAPTASSYKRHPITDKFKLMTIYPLARSLRIVPAKEMGIVVQPLAMTIESAWGETNRKDLTEKSIAKEDEGRDNPGPLILSAVIEIEDIKDKQEGINKAGKADKGTIVVFGDSDFVADSYIKLSGNLDFFMNAVNWLTHDDNLISIRPKEAGIDPIIFTARQLYIIIAISIIGLPASVLFAGIWTSVRRKRS
ncbi:MAG: GldG family protein [Nitrospinota bacterium]